MGTHPELNTEQHVLDRAYAIRDAATHAAPAGEPLIFGRVDRDEDHRYIGRENIVDDDGTPLVIAWHSPQAAPFYAAGPGTVALKRQFVEHQRELTALHDEIVHGDGDTNAAAREQMERFRDGTLHDVAATLTPQQYAAVTAQPDALLVVTGGPGTGKTQVGLHRAAWLAHHHPELRAAGIAFVSATAALRAYVSDVLPALDAADVVNTDLESINGTYAHIVVDEAQDLSQHDLHTLTRACPTGSFTLIGDLPHARDPDRLNTWADLSAPLSDQIHHVTLSTSFRVPSPVADLLRRQLQLISVDGTPVTSLRAGIGGPLVRRGDSTELAGDALRAATAAASTGFRVGVIVPAGRYESTVQLADDSDMPCADGAGNDDAGLSRPVTVLTAADANGLEFDAVALVAPDEIVKESGHGALHLALSRCTQSLAIFHAEPLPAGLEELDQAARGQAGDPTGDPSLHELVDALSDADKVIVEALVRRLLNR